ncbi:MAG TPA: hypothetical protein VEI57_01800 [Nitrospirota bacterium]|nr:hypothetical protein [Nitrospirota bacterium]
MLILDIIPVNLDGEGELFEALELEVYFAASGREIASSYQSALYSGQPSYIVMMDLMFRRGIGNAHTLQQLRESIPS